MQLLFDVIPVVVIVTVGIVCADIVVYNVMATVVMKLSLVKECKSLAIRVQPHPFYNSSPNWSIEAEWLCLILSLIIFQIKRAELFLGFSLMPSLDKQRTIVLSKKGRGIQIKPALYLKNCS